METIIVSIIFLATLTFLYVSENKRRKGEIERFREFVRAVRSEDVDKYVQTEPRTEKKVVQEVEDEYIAMDDIPPDELLNKLK